MCEFPLCIFDAVLWPLLECLKKLISVSCPRILSSSDFSLLLDCSLAAIIWVFQHNSWLKVITGVKWFWFSWSTRNINVENIFDIYDGFRSMIGRNTTVGSPRWFFNTICVNSDHGDCRDRETIHRIFSRYGWFRLGQVHWNKVLFFVIVVIFNHNPSNPKYLIGSYFPITWETNFLDVRVAIIAIPWKIPCPSRVRKLWSTLSAVYGTNWPSETVTTLR